MELVVAMAVCTVLIVVSLGVTFAMIKTTNAESVKSDANDAARLAVAQIERQVRSGNVLYDPQHDDTTHDTTLRIYTQANAVEKCVEWKYDYSAHTLLSRSWSTTWESDNQITAWRTIASNVVNGPDVADQPFTLDPSSVYGGRLLNIDVLARVGDLSRPAEVQASVTGRNTSYGYSKTVCNNPPPE